MPKTHEDKVAHAMSLAHKMWCERELGPLARASENLRHFLETEMRSDRQPVIETGPLSDVHGWIAGGNHEQ